MAGQLRRWTGTDVQVLLLARMHCKATGTYGAASCLYIPRVPLHIEEEPHLSDLGLLDKLLPVLEGLCIVLPRLLFLVLLLCHCLFQLEVLFSAGAF